VCSFTNTNARSNFLYVFEGVARSRTPAVFLIISRFLHGILITTKVKVWVESLNDYDLNVMIKLKGCVKI
jgi:hypothetical protein